MNRRQRAIIRQYTGEPQTHIPFTVAFWSLWALTVLSMLHYLGAF